MARRLAYTTALTTLFSYGLLFAFGQLRDLFRHLLGCFRPNKDDDVKQVGRTPDGLISSARRGREKERSRPAAVLNLAAPTFLRW
jgi:hypothetical protein